MMDNFITAQIQLTVACKGFYVLCNLAEGLIVIYVMTVCGTSISSHCVYCVPYTCPGPPTCASGVCLFVPYKGQKKRLTIDANWIDNALETFVDLYISNISSSVCRADLHRQLSLWAGVILKDAVDCCLSSQHDCY